MAIRKIQASILILVITVIPCGHCSFTPTDHYLIDCGSLQDTIIGNRVFQADDSVSWTLKSSSNNLANISEKNMVPSYYGMEQLFQNARVFTEPASYTFQIRKHGRHFIRLYFFPSVYESYNLTAASFSVSTQDITLLNNFRPPLNVTVKEFSLNILSDTLSLSFAPSRDMPIAFVNAIEIMSVPDNLTGDGAPIIHQSSTNYHGLSGQALETFYRINMGNLSVFPDNDTLWRLWENDQKYLISKNLSQPSSYRGRIYRNDGVSQDIAPDMVYATATEFSVTAQKTLSYSVNITWQFNVDAKSSYFIRFHFCDIVSLALNSLLFNVYVNTWLAAGNLDLSQKTFDRLATAVFLDFVLEADDASDILSIKVNPADAPLGDATPNAILNGLEIMKINGQTVGTPTGSNKNFRIILGSSLGAIVVIIIAVVLFFILRKKRPAKQFSKTWVPFSATGLTSHSTVTAGTSNGIPFMDGQNGNLGYRFSFITVQEATNNFDENLVIGVGGFGKVYEGVLRDETKVAVKRGNPKSQQGLNEFRTEIELLSRLRHRHLVSLIGYCDEKKEMILVYEYMEKGTLKSHLYGSGLPSLSWKQRLEICIGSARGLHYLHTGQAKAVIHRDVKSANILLDENLLAKVADFGLSKTGPELDQTHVSTAVKGSFGYLDPEYYRRQQLTEKSDVYSFGVVLLEVLCARPVIDPTLPREMVNLADWGLKWQMKGELEHVADVRIAGSIKPESLRKFGLTIEKCLADSGAERPSMGDVLWNLEYVLQLQEADGDDSEINSINRITELAPQVGNICTMENTSAVEDTTSLQNDVTDTSMSKVFSQLIKSEGR